MHLRQYEIVSDVDKLKVDLQAVFMKYKTIKQWAYIIHDKDDTRPHYHIYINFGNTGVDSALVAKWFELGYVDETGVEHSGEQFIEKVKGRKADILLYLTHENDSQKFKHIYSRDEVVANFDFGLEIEQSKIIGNFEKYSYAQQVEYCNSLPIPEKAKAFSQLKRLWELQCQCSTLITDRSIKVGFIEGKGGTGKTFYAKKLCKSMGYDFCISSSSNDPFQDYLGQRAMILDDLRDKSFELEDFLKIIDNNTNSSVKSRFNNKVFNGKLILITSTVPLHYWYSKYKSNAFDTLIQLYRRINFYVCVEKEEIYFYNDGVDSTGRPHGAANVFVNELGKEAQSKVKDNEILSAFSKMCETQMIFEQESIFTENFSEG